MTVADVIEMKVELNPWMVPNFVTAKMPPRPRQEGFAEGPKWSLSEVDADTLASQCDQFRAEVFRKAGKSDPANASSDNVAKLKNHSERRTETWATT